MGPGPERDALKAWTWSFGMQFARAMVLVSDTHHAKTRRDNIGFGKALHWYADLCQSKQHLIVPHHCNTAQHVSNFSLCSA